MRRRSATMTLAAAALVAGCGAQAPPPSGGGAVGLRPAAAVQRTPVVPAVPLPVAVRQQEVAPETERAVRRAVARAAVRKPQTALHPDLLPGPLAAPRGGWQSTPEGRPSGGALRRGVLFPESGPDHVTWDPILHRSPNRDWRRVGTDHLVATILMVASTWRAANPGAPPLLVSDISLPLGGPFDGRYGGLGHASHQNGLDVDIQYPRRDRRPIGVSGPAEIDRALAQDLVDRFVAAGARFVFVGPHTGLGGPAGVVQPLAHHDDHLHVRIWP